MPKHADGPAAGRMGFGYEQAKAAGAPFIAPRSGTEINEEIREATAARQLRALIEKDVNFGPKIGAMLKQGRSAQEILAELAPMARP